MPTYYDILGVEENDSFEIIKVAYRKLVLNLHPDKSSNSPADIKITTGLDFNRIQQAWDCLRNEDLRHQYDDEIQRKREKQNLNNVRATIVQLHEMKCEEADCETESGCLVTQNVYSYSCRCGDSFELFEDELPISGGSVILECNSCALSIRICTKESPSNVT